MSAVADKLREARALIERGWCQHSFTETKAGVLCYCIYGAINQAVVGIADAGLDEETAPFEKMLGRAIGVDHLLLSSWNDTRGRTQAVVLAAFDKAIELAEQSL